MPHEVDCLVGAGNALVRVRVWPGDSPPPPEVETIHEGSGFYYGITHDEDYLFVLARNYWNERRGANSVLVFDRGLRLVDEQPLAFARVGEAHQAIYWDGLLHVCNTARNCLTSIHLESRRATDFYPLPDRRDRNFNHLNSVWTDGSRLVLGFANRFRDSFRMTFSYTERTLLSVDALGLAAHNAIPFAHGHLVCSSLNGSVMHVCDTFDDAGAERPLTRIVLLPDEGTFVGERLMMSRVVLRHFHSGYTYPRGLALGKDALWIGLSEFGKRSSRRDSRGRLAMIHGFRRDYTGEGKLWTADLGETGAVCEVRLLNAVDAGHPSPTAKPFLPV